MSPVAETSCSAGKRRACRPSLRTRRRRLLALRLEPIAELLHDLGHEQQLLSAVLGLGVGIVEEGHGQVAAPRLVVAAEELVLGPQPHRVELVVGELLVLLRQGLLLFLVLSPRSAAICPPHRVPSSPGAY